MPLIKDLCRNIRDEMVVLLPWLSDFSILTRSYHGGLVSKGEGGENFAIDDRRGPHGYIRFDQSPDITYSDPQRKISANQKTATARLAMVLIFKSDNPEGLAEAIGSVFGSIRFSNANIDILSTDGDSDKILKGEIGTGSQVWSAVRIKFMLSWEETFNCKNPILIMSNCCTNFIDLGCATCDQITTTIEVAPGDYTIEFIFEGASKFVEVEFTDTVFIPLIGLNENYEYIARIYNSEGVMEFTYNGITANCFKFKTSLMTW